MVFKLNRVDFEESQKIRLFDGTHVIGRGQFLHNDCNDKRVSRQHAELEVTDHTISLKSLHQNPCFYIRKSTQETIILNQNDKINLNSGDKFGLLPDNFWYEILHCSDSELAENIPINKKNEINNENNKCKENTNGIDNVIIEGRNDKDAIDFDMVEENKQTSNPGSPSLLSTKTTDQESTSKQRPHDSPDSSPVEIKKVKKEPNSPQAGSSNDKVASNADDGDQKPSIGGLKSPDTSPAPVLQRERCLYGANCYRHNPQHKVRFSHPSESDWGTGPKGVCPYGSLCRRTDPRHWQHHEHPPGVNRPPLNGRRQATETTDQESTQAYTVKNETNSGPNTPIKRPHDSPDSSPVENKKVKKEPNSPQAGSSNDKDASNADDSGQKPSIGALKSPDTPPVPVLQRERCIYGANCYRRNPQHKARFSHPSDSDWGGPKPVCPYGSLCRRTDPRHSQHHEHPLGVNPPPLNGRRQGDIHLDHHQGNIFYINAHSVNFYDDHFQVEYSDGDSIDYDYEF